MDLVPGVRHSLRLRWARPATAADWLPLCCAEQIRTDPQLKATLKERSGVQLKDKWRNLVKLKHVRHGEVGKASGGKSVRAAAPARSPDKRLLLACCCCCCSGPELTVAVNAAARQLLASHPSPAPAWPTQQWCDDQRALGLLPPSRCEPGLLLMLLQLQRPFMAASVAQALTRSCRRVTAAARESRAASEDG